MSEPLPYQTKITQPLRGKRKSAPINPSGIIAPALTHLETRAPFGGADKKQPPQFVSTFTAILAMICMTKCTHPSTERNAQDHNSGRRGHWPTNTYEHHRLFSPAAPPIWQEHVCCILEKKIDGRFSPLGGRWMEANLDATWTRLRRLQHEATCSAFCSSNSHGRHFTRTRRATTANVEDLGQQIPTNIIDYSRLLLRQFGGACVLHLRKKK